MITVNTRRHRRSRQPTAHKLQQRHLGTRILHSHAIRLELQIRLPTNIAAIVGAAQQRLLRRLQMRIQDLFGERQGAGRPQHAAHFAEAAQELCVRRRARGEVHVAGMGDRGRGCEGSCVCGEAGGVEVRL